jgi:hypothetical protein
VTSDPSIPSEHPAKYRIDSISRLPLDGRTFKGVAMMDPVFWAARMRFFEKAKKRIRAALRRRKEN